MNTHENSHEYPLIPGNPLDCLFPIRLPKTWFFRNRSLFSNLRVYQVAIHIHSYPPISFGGAAAPPPAGYNDVSGGSAFYWSCAFHCEGGPHYATEGCICACLTPEQEKAWRGHMAKHPELPNVLFVRNRNE